MKKIISVLLFSFVLTGLFAQSAKYNELMEKAKQFETKKQWVHAAGAYADAIVADPENASEAYVQMTSLLSSIELGNPGREAVSKFDLEENWKKLLLDAEQYWTVNMPYEIEISDLTQTDIDSKTRTATYTVEISLEYSGYHSDDYSEYYSDDKYKIMSAIKKGYETVYQPSWKKSLPEPKTWPRVSTQKPAAAKMINEEYYTLITDQKAYKVNNVALLGIPANTWAGTTYTLGISCFTNAWTKRLYFMKFNIVDETGKVLATSRRTFINDKGTVTFSGIPENVMDIIDSGKAKVVTAEILLDYGYSNKDLPTYIYDDDDFQELLKLLKPLPEISVSVDKAMMPGTFEKARQTALGSFLRLFVEPYIKETDTYTHHLKVFTKSSIDYEGHDDIKDDIYGFLVDHFYYESERYYPPYYDSSVVTYLLNICYPGSDFDYVYISSEERKELKAKLGFEEDNRIYVSKVKLTDEEKKAVVDKAKAEAAELLEAAKKKALEYEENKTAFNPTDKEAFTQTDTYINAVAALENSLHGTDPEAFINAEAEFKNLKTDRIEAAIENVKKLDAARKASEEPLKTAKEKLAAYEKFEDLPDNSYDIRENIRDLKSAIASLKTEIKGYDVAKIDAARKRLTSFKTDKIEAAIKSINAAIAKGKKVMLATGFEVTENDKSQIVVTSVTPKSKAAKVLKVDDVISIKEAPNLEAMYIYFSRKNSKDTVILSNSRINKKGKSETKEVKLVIK